MRLIDADALKEKICNNVYPITDFFNSQDYGMFWTGGIEKAIDEAPTIDAELVIRCKDCNFCGEIDENGWHCCENLGVGMPKNGFCSDAERKGCNY